jgi:protein-S-isoprenylcysteine O-methyltransferase Ste14
MATAPTRLLLRALLGLVFLVAVLGAAIFAAAGTVRYGEAWALLAIFGGASLAVTLDLARRDPALLARRTQAGPVAETKGSQKVIQAMASLLFLALVVVPGLDRRFGWSRAPLPAVVGGDLLVALGFYAVFRVFRANTFTSGTIEVAPDQRVVDTGPYAVVRHPMYAGALLLLAGMPVALGSLVGLLVFPPFVAVLAWRLLDEERYLAGHLAGYVEYARKTKYRLVPGLW